jgi:hypothetical protein
MFDTIQLKNDTPLEINEDEFLSKVLKDRGYDLSAIPTNCVLDKTLPGLGATYSEIEAKRNSIIIEPNVPVIKGKTEGEKKLLGVFESVSDKKIKEYLLNNKIAYKKILCTPESYMKVKNIAENNNIDLYDTYFCLYDECEKITQDIDYRERISLPMNDFFMYRNKAFVSATPLQLRNPQFKEQNFSILKVKPLFEYRKKIRLITTNRYEVSLLKLLDDLKDSPLVCIFLNSTNGINKLVNLLEEKGITDYKAFCSKKSEIKFKKKNIHKSFEDLELPLAKYNFFTSRFYSAVDIYTVNPPDIIILTDLHEALHSRIDPFTNAIQIYGRFRNKHANKQKFNSLTHISNYGSIGEVLTEQEIESYIRTSERIYNELKNNPIDTTNKGAKKALNDTLKGCSYNKFLDDNGDINYFKIDNFFDDERVRGYYQGPDNLLKAYEATGHFVVDHSNMLYIVSDKDLLKYKKMPSRMEQRKFLVKKLHTFYSSGEYTTEQLQSVEAVFLQVDKREQLEEAQFTISAFKKLGKEAMENAGYYKNKIERLLRQHEKENNERLMYSEEVFTEIRRRFSDYTTYNKEELFDGFKEVFEMFGITHKVNLATVQKYFSADPCKAKNEIGCIRLFKFSPIK